MGHQRLADISRDAEGRQVGAHQAADVDQDGRHRKQHRQPAIADDLSGLGVIGSHFENLPNDEKEERQGEQGQNRTDGGQQQR